MAARPYQRRIANTSVARGMAGAWLPAHSIVEAPLMSEDGVDAFPSASVSAAATPGSSFPKHPRFEPMSVLGHGSMGSVYKVYDREIGIPVALKTLQESAPELVYRLKQEFRALAGVVHPNLVQLFELLVEPELRCFTMELVDGLDFVSYLSAQAPTPAEWLERFRDSAVQLLCGLRAVHAAGRMHRDVKPSNIRIETGGRVVLLDFDLMAPLGGDGQSVLPSAAAGTFAYMPPEMLWAKPVGTASDLYSVGVILYEVLNGQPPFTNPLQLKRTPPRSLGPRQDLFPSRVREAILGLLETDPEDRPRLEEVLDALAGEDRSDRLVERFRDRRTELVGREPQMARLREWARAGEETTRVICVSGPSGSGKTELVRRYLEAEEADPRALVLVGRCHPQESVPFKVLDAILDALGRFLAAQSPARLQAWLPPNVGALARLFPVLGRIEGVPVPIVEPGDLDSLELRRTAFGALRELLLRVGRERRLLLWADDLQWGDADSAALLADVLRPPDPPALVLLLSYRSDDAGGIPTIQELERLANDARGLALSHMEVGPLSDADANALARRLCPGIEEEDLAGVVAQASGVPFMLGELARYLRRRRNERGAPTPPLELSDVLQRRLQDLPERARRLMDLVTVAGVPIERSVLLQASADGEPGRAIVALLESECLVRSTPLEDRLGVEAYHDRIREGVLRQLQPERRVGCHAALAGALEASGRASPELLASHFHGAGSNAKAADYAVLAATRAGEALAFVRAAQLFRQAREWDERDVDWRGDLLAREGEALSNAAHFEDASRAFLEAVPLAPLERAHDLRRRAGEQLLAAGRLDDGVALLAELLRDLGLQYPASPSRATFAVLLRLGGFALAGIEPRRGHATGPEALLRVDTCYSVGKCLINADAVRGVYFAVEALYHALRAAEPIRIGCALAVVGGSISVIEGPLLAGLGERMLESAESIATATDSALVRGTLDACLSQVSLLQGRWRESLDYALRGAQLLSERCRGAAYESATARRVALRAFEELGEIAELGRLSREIWRAALDQRDRYSEVVVAQPLATVALAADDLDLARRYAASDRERWTSAGFHIQHFSLLRQRAHCDLYGGRPWESWQAWTEAWRPLRASGLMRIALPRVDAYETRGKLALALAREAPSQRRELLSIARNSIQRLRREAAHAQARAALLQAGLERLQGKNAVADASLAEAAAAARAQGMIFHAAAADLRRGQSMGGSDGRRLSDAACDTMRQRGVKDPLAWSRIYVAA